MMTAEVLKADSLFRRIAVALGVSAGRNPRARIEPALDAPLQPRHESNSTTGIVAVASMPTSRRNATHSTRRSPPATTGAIDPLLKSMSPQDLAERFCAYLVAQYGAGVSVDASEVVQAYKEFCLEYQIQPLSWNPVAFALRRLCGGFKTYRSEAKNRIRVYILPASPATREARAA